MTPGVSPLTIELGVQGMTCASCAARLERTLVKRPGVVAAEVQLVHERARIRIEPGTTVESLFDAIEAAGFEPNHLPNASVLQASGDEEARFAAVAKRDGRLLFACIVLAAPLLLPMLGMLLGRHWHLPPWVEFALATPVQFWLGARFYRAGAKALVHGSANMDVLVALGTSAAYFYSVAQLLGASGQSSLNLYFEASAVVITLVRLGKWLESKAKRGTTAALRELIQLQPERVTVRRHRSGQLETSYEDIVVGSAELQIGMLIVVRPGERFAADGIVVEGQAAVDESMLTGESLPIPRRAGDEVLGGSLNVNGLVVAQISRLGSDTTLGGIIQMVYGAQAGKAEVQQLVDRVSAWFVPGVLGIAALTFAGWWIGTGRLEMAMVAAVSVLVIACPCALGLATPTAIVAGTGAAAQSGILVRDVDTLQRASQIDTLVFDKTGTLTEGRPTVAEVAAYQGSVEDLLRRAASVEQASLHPLASAIVEHAKQKGLTLSMPVEFESHTSDGVSGLLNGQRVRVGQLSWLVQCGVATAPDRDASRGAKLASAVVGVALDEVLLGTIAIADSPRESAKDAIRLLRRRNLRVILLSGDDERVARALATELGIPEAVGRARPEDKQALIARLCREGSQVAMIGDGINDAPALAAADVGIAIGGGTQVAMQTANVVIMRPDLRLVAATLGVARATFGKIRQNLFWAFVYNCVGIPLAAAGRLSPMIAGLAMALSSVSVVSNSLLLRRWRPKSS